MRYIEPINSTRDINTLGAIPSKWVRRIKREPWLVEGAEPTGVYFDPGVVGLLYDLVWKPDGTAFFVLNAYLNYTVRRFNLSTAWDIGSAYWSGQSCVINPNSAFQPRSVSFKPDGSRMFIFDGNDQKLLEYHLSSAWNVGTASLYGAKVLNYQAQYVFNAKMQWYNGGDWLYITYKTDLSSIGAIFDGPPYSHVNRIGLAWAHVPNFPLVTSTFIPEIGGNIYGIANDNTVYQNSMIAFLPSLGYSTENVSSYEVPGGVYNGLVSLNPTGTKMYIYNGQTKRMQEFSLV